MALAEPTRARIWPNFAWVPHGSASSVTAASASETPVPAPGASSPASMRTSARA